MFQSQMNTNFHQDMLAYFEGWSSRGFELSCDAVWNWVEPKKNEDHPSF